VQRRAIGSAPKLDALRRVREYLHDRIGEPVSTATLAKVAGMSRFGSRCSFNTPTAYRYTPIICRSDSMTRVGGCAAASPLQQWPPISGSSIRLTSIGGSERDSASHPLSIAAQRYKTPDRGRATVCHLEHTCTLTYRFPCSARRCRPASIVKA